MQAPEVVRSMVLVEPLEDGLWEARARYPEAMALLVPLQPSSQELGFALCCKELPPVGRKSHVLIEWCVPIPRHRPPLGAACEREFATSHLLGMKEGDCPLVQVPSGHQGLRSHYHHWEGHEALCESDFREKVFQGGDSGVAVQDEN